MPGTAPAVLLHGREDRHWRRLHRALSLAVFGGAVGWCGLLWRQGTALQAWHITVPVIAGVIAVVTWRRATDVWELRWDGATWSLDAAPCHAHATLDLGRWLLVRLVPAAPSPSRWTRPQHRWLALSRRDHPAAWHGLRCALYCPRPQPPHPPGHGAAPFPDER